MKLRYQASGSEGYEPIIKGNDLLQYIHEFGILRLQDDVYENQTGACEAIFHVIEGSCTLTVDGKTYPDLGSREDPFQGRPTAFFLPAGTAYTIQADRAEIAITHAKVSGGGNAALISADDLTPKQVGKENWQRTVTMIAPPDFSSQKLILGETINPPGNWSGVPTHKHDTYIPGRESVHEELYYFRANSPGGWGLERIYDKTGMDEMVLLQDRVVTIMPHGYHTVSSAPGHTLYYAFVLAGPAKPLLVSLDPDQAWIAD
jgi:5-deoxy-glucuronate isomerase